MKTTLKYSQELVVKLLEFYSSSTSNVTNLVIYMEVPRYFLHGFVNNVDVVSVASTNPQNIYAPSQFVTEKGKPVDSLPTLQNIGMEYLRACHKSVGVYQQMLEAGVLESQASAVLPAQSLVDVVLCGSIPQWNSWIEKVGSNTKDELCAHYAKRVKECLHEARTEGQ